MKPKELIERIERQVELSAGEDERFSGYAVMGVTFESRHVLCLRRFPASSLGRGYTSVWHRDPQDRWIFYQDIQPGQACSRYFGRALAESRVGEITVTWPEPDTLRVSVQGDIRLEWESKLARTPGTSLLNGASRAMPGPLWRMPRVLTLMGRAAGLVLNAGRISLVGKVPNGQRFIAHPRLLWSISSCRATLDGEDLGRPRPLPIQARLGEFWIPQRGIFAVAEASLESFDPARHAATTEASAVLTCQSDI